MIMMLEGLGGNSYRFKSAELFSSGGGIYICTGQVSNGDYFTADTDMWDVRFLDADPMGPSDEGYDFAFETVEWQEAHLVRDLDCTSWECYTFWCSLFNYLKKTDKYFDYDKFMSWLDRDFDREIDYWSKL